MAKRPRELTLAARELITPHMLRLTLSGDSLGDFPEGLEGGYIKLMLPQPDGGTATRSFTVRHFDSDRRELVIHMVSHGVVGPASNWASRVEPGDRITTQGPGACKRLLPEADWFVVAGDMSALPAISVNLEQLPDDAVGHAVLEVIDPSDEIELACPPGIELQWLHNPKPERPNSMLQDAVMALPWREGRPSVWVAGEFASSRALRQYFRHERKVDPEALYVSSYWKIGATDEGMKAAKRADAEAW